MPDGVTLVERLVVFGHELRAEGLSVGSGDIMTFCAAAAALNPGEIQDLYWSGRTTLVTQRDQIPVTLITDNMAGYFMAQGRIDLIIVGADRIAANGDVANKIGTYSVAVLAKEHGIPFYVAAPLSTIDRAIASGADIPIEQRAGDEVRLVGSQRIAAAEIEVENPAFDVTPARYIRGVITEVGVASPPNNDTIAALFA